MAKKATTKSGASKSGTARSSAKANERKPARAVAKRPARASGGGSQDSQSGATEAFLKFLESPLVAELLAVGATAALGAIAATGFSRGADGRRSTRMLKAAAKAAATAMGQRLATEVDEIRRASKPAKERGGA